MSGKKGNKNAYKHGIYTKFIAVIDDEEMADMPLNNNKHELAVARVNLAHAIEERDKASGDDVIKWDGQICRYLEIIGTYIFGNRDAPEVERTIYTSWLDALRTANDKQNVKR